MPLKFFASSRGYYPRLALFMEPAEYYPHKMVKTTTKKHTTNIIIKI